MILGRVIVRSSLPCIYLNQLRILKVSMHQKTNWTNGLVLKVYSVRYFIVKILGYDKLGMKHTVYETYDVYAFL